MVVCNDPVTSKPSMVQHRGLSVSTGMACFVTANLCLPEQLPQRTCLPTSESHAQCQIRNTDVNIISTQAVRVQTWRKYVEDFDEAQKVVHIRDDAACNAWICATTPAQVMKLTNRL